MPPAVATSALAVAAAAALAGLACSNNPPRPPAEPPSAPPPTEPEPSAMTDPDSTPPCHPERSAAELRDQVSGALGGPGVGVHLTPVLPARWPAPAGGVVYFTYRVEPLPSGRVRYRVAGPLQRIELASLGGAPAVAQLAPAAALGDEGGADWPDGFAANLAAAEQVVVELAAGCRGADGEARAALAPYATWLAGHPAIAADVEPRAPAFFAWLRAP